MTSITKMHGTMNIKFYDISVMGIMSVSHVII